MGRPALVAGTKPPRGSCSDRLVPDIAEEEFVASTKPSRGSCDVAYPPGLTVVRQQSRARSPRAALCDVAIVGWSVIVVTCREHEAPARLLWPRRRSDDDP